jgi:hypothetical protein
MATAASQMPEGLAAARAASGSSANGCKRGWQRGWCRVRQHAAVVSGLAQHLAHSGATVAIDWLVYVTECILGIR